MKQSHCWEHFPMLVMTIKNIKRRRLLFNAIYGSICFQFMRELFSTYAQRFSLYARTYRLLQSRISQSGLSLIFAAPIFVRCSAVFVRLEEENLAYAFVDVNAQRQVCEVG